MGLQSMLQHQTVPLAWVLLTITPDDFPTLAAYCAYFKIVFLWPSATELQPSAILFLPHLCEVITFQAQKTLALS